MNYSIKQKYNHILIRSFANAPKNLFKAAKCEYVDMIRAAQSKLNCLAFVELR